MHRLALQITAIHRVFSVRFVKLNSLKINLLYNHNVHCWSTALMNGPFKLNVGLFRYYDLNTNDNLHGHEEHHAHPGGKLSLVDNVLTWT